MEIQEKDKIQNKDLLKDRDGLYWWKDEGTIKGRRRPKTTLGKVIKNDMSIKEVAKSMDSNII